MDEVAESTSVNSVGLAILLEAVMKKPVERLVAASSMSLHNGTSIGEKCA